MTRQKGMASNRHFSLMKSMHNFAQFRSIVDDIGQVIAGRIVKASLNGEDPKESSFDSANLNRFRSSFRNGVARSFSHCEIDAQFRTTRLGF
jgi:hypothetical protein